VAELRCDGMTDESAPRRATGLPGTVIADFRRAGLPGSLRDEIRDLYAFYVSEEERARLARSGRLVRWVRVAWILVRNALLRLSPSRRVLLVAACALALVSPSFGYGGLTIRINLWPWVSLALLVVLMLELKDKLLARDEIEVARRVQISLMPSLHPSVAGWTVWSVTTPANSVGGDLVDYLSLPGPRSGIALGDVAGKGMGAALLAAKLQATLRALAPETERLEILGERLNEILHRDGLDNRFATLWYAEIRPGSPRVRWLNAGHNAALLVRADSIEALGASSYPLGMLAEPAGYREDARDLAPGDLIVAYSDGIVEATNPAGREWGLETLRNVIVSGRGQPPEALGRRIIEAVDAFLDGARAQDDRSLVVLRFHGGGPAARGSS